MPAGVPVATVSIGGARNAGLLAVRILAVSDPALRSRIVAFQEQLAESVLAKDAALKKRQVKLPASSTAAVRRTKQRWLGWAGDPSFDLFKLPEEHDELRAAIRALAEKEIAPYAADVDEKPRFPEEALSALNASGFNAVHVPEEYGGQGADSVAACIVIEEVARVDASASLIPAVNKLGTMGLILRGSEELKKQVLPSLASDGAMASYALSEREAGSDAASMRTRAKADGDDWILNGTKVLDHQRRQVDLVHGDGGDRPGQGRQRDLGVHRAQGRRGFQRRAQGKEVGHQGFADHRAVLRELPGSRRPDHR